MEATTDIHHIVRQQDRRRGRTWYDSKPYIYGSITFSDTNEDNGTI